MSTLYRYSHYLNVISTRAVRLAAVRLAAVRLAAIGMVAMLLLSPLPLWAATVQIESGKMTLYHKKNQVIFTDKVHLTRDDFELYCDRLVAYYNDKDLDHADAFGHIRLRHGKATGHADKAVLNQAKGILTLTGNAVLVQDGNRVEGEQIVHDMNKQQTVVLPGKGGRTHMTIESSDDNSKLLPGSGQQP